MAWIALKMLIGSPARYFAIVFGIAFASMLMAQQAAIFVGLMRNTTSQIRDIQGADIWVMNRSVEFVDDITPMSDNDLYRVRGVPGVQWAVPLYKGTGRAQFPDGNFKQFVVLGLDESSFVGAPQKLILGNLAELRQPDAVILDETGFRYLFPDEPFHVGQTFEMNDHRAKVVGICVASPTLQTFPIIYTRYSQAIKYAAQERRVLSFVLAKRAGGVETAELCERIERQLPDLMALSNQGFAWATMSYYLRRTGIPINFGTTVLLGFIIGAAIAGQSFYLFTIGNLKQFGAMKAMGANNLSIVRMVLTQGMFVGAIGYGLGMGAAAITEVLMTWRFKDIPPSFYMAWQIPVGTALAVISIVIVTTLFSLRRVMVLEPASVFH